MSSKDKCLAPKRIEWVDYGKGLAILLVFWGHTVCPEPVRAVFYAFHIPVFYVLSGYVFSTRRYRSFGPFLWRKVRTLVIPGVVFGLLLPVLYALNAWFMNKPHAIHFVKLLISVFVEMRGSYFVIPWFFASLFIVECLAYWLLAWARDRAWILVALALTGSLMGYLYATFIGRVVPWGIETACTGFGFFMLGYMAKNVRPAWLDEGTRMLWVPLWIVLSGAGTWLNVNIAGEYLDIYLNRYGWYPFYMMAAIGGIFAVLGVLRALERHAKIAVVRPLCAALRYFGRNSFVLYCLNQVGLLVAEEILASFGVVSSPSDWSVQLLTGLAYVAIAVVLCIPFVEATDRWLPWLMGKPVGRSKPHPVAR